MRDRPSAERSGRGRLGGRRILAIAPSDRSTTPGDLGGPSATDSSPQGLARSSSEDRAREAIERRDRADRSRARDPDGAAAHLRRAASSLGVSEEARAWSVGRPVHLHLAHDRPRSPEPDQPCPHTVKRPSGPLPRRSPDPQDALRRRETRVFQPSPLRATRSRRGCRASPGAACRRDRGDLRCGGEVSSRAADHCPRRARRGDRIGSRRSPRALSARSNGCRSGSGWLHPSRPPGRVAASGGRGRRRVRLEPHERLLLDRARPGRTPCRGWGDPREGSSIRGVKIAREHRRRSEVGAKTNTLSERVHLPGERLHRLVVAPFRVREDGERIPGEGSLGEDVAQSKRKSAHGVEVSCHDADLRVARIEERSIESRRERSARSPEAEAVLGSRLVAVRSRMAR